MKSKKKEKVKVSISISKELLEKIDKQRDDVPRSRFIERILSEVLK